VSTPFALEFQDPTGERLDFGWDPDRLEQLDGELGPDLPWLLDGELDWDEIELIRVLSARLEDGRLLGVVALRPAGADGHGQEIVAAAMVNSDGEVGSFAEALLSLEYDREREPRRVGLELYREEGSIPLRVAGDVTAAETVVDGSAQRTSAALSVRAAGTHGHGRLDLLRLA
jgi:hypothetical protein